MITNQLMIRPMGDFQVTQRTKDGMFNATELLRQWNEKNGTDKKMFHYFDNVSSDELINEIVKREKFTCRNSVYVKSKASRGDNAGTWMHPILFIDFAMWINASFKYDVLKFVYDKMLEYRNENCEAYKQLSSAVSKVVEPNRMRRSMKKVAEALNWIVFGGHEKMMRNKRGEEELQKELWELEKKVATLINEDFITSFEHLIDYLRNQYKKKHTPSVFL